MFEGSLIKGIVFSGLVVISQPLLGQHGIGTDKPSRAAALDIRASSKGVLIPRVELQKTHQFSPPIIGDSSNNQNGVSALLVYNIADHNDVSPGFYYWSTEEGQWIRFLSGEETIEPWQVQGTSDKALLNTDDIYQRGTVAIGKVRALVDTSGVKATLDVKGIIRGGQPNPEAKLGSESIAVGKNVEASGEYSAAFGNGSQALDFNAFAAGHDVRAEGNSSVAMGHSTIASGNYALASGKNIQAEGYYSLAMGRHLKTKTGFEAAFGRYNVLFSGHTISKWKPDDPLFVIGNGSSLSEGRQNALTLLKDGRLGIGIDGNDDSAKPTEMLDLGKGKLRIRDLPVTKGGISDSIVVVNSRGVLRALSPANLKTQGPWFKQGTTQPTTDNYEDIYQTGSVAVGKDKGLEGVTLAVKGAIRSGQQYASGKTTQIGENSIGLGQYVGATAKNAAAFGYSSMASGEGAFAGGGFASAPGGKASGKSAFAFGHNAEASQKYAVAMGEGTVASNYYSLAVGKENKAIGNSSVALGRDTRAEGNYSAVFGRGATTNSLSAMVIGQYNTDLGGSRTQWNEEDPLFEIGNGKGRNNRSNAVTVHKDGWVGLGYTEPVADSILFEKLSVKGSIYANDHLYTATSSYPDYVFQNYYGSATQRPDYRFRPLSAYKAYVRKEHHLPGVASIKDLKQTSDQRYIFDANQLTLQTLEKIEELFLYIFAQDEKINHLTKQVRALKQELKFQQTDEGKNFSVSPKTREPVTRPNPCKVFPDDLPNTR